MKTLIVKDLEALKSKPGQTSYITLNNNTIAISYCHWFFRGQRRMGWLSHKLGKDKHLFDVRVEYAAEHIYNGLVAE